MTIKKSAKGKDSVAVSPVDQDVVGLITTLVGKLVSLETKMDTLLSRIAMRPAEIARQQPVQIQPAQQHRDTRMMHKAVCADCRKDCEVPFRPSPDRPVYCKECFAKRKSNGTFKPQADRRPKESQPPAQAQLPVKPPAAGRAKTVKKKPAAKKKKK